MSSTQQKSILMRVQTPQTSLFDDLQVPQTEGIKYVGSKLKILPHIIQIINRLKIRTALDAFSGTTRVAQAFSQLGFDTSANDIAEYSEIFGHCYLLSTKPNEFYQKFIDELNSLKGTFGWFSQHYGGENEAGKRPFQLKNTMKLDAIRDKIDEFDLNFTDKAVLLTSLILALDCVDNTLGHYASYLSGWCKRSYNDLFLRLPRRFAPKTQNRVIKSDAFKAITNFYDLVYFDPPYGSNNEKMPPSRVRYKAYYHFYKSVILNDKPRVFGKANRREDSRDTAFPCIFEEFKRDESNKFIAMRAIERLIANTNARYILLSYSSGGRASKQELQEIISLNGRLLDAHEIDYKKNVMSAMRWSYEWVNDDNTHKEYLFLLER